MNMIIGVLVLMFFASISFRKGYMEGYEEGYHDGREHR